MSEKELNRHVEGQLPFTIFGISHIGLGPKSPKETSAFFGQILKLPFFGSELVVPQQTMTHMFGSQTKKNGSEIDNHQNRLEILEATPNDAGPIADFLSKRGGGIHHIAFRVDSVDAVISYLNAQNVTMIHNQPQDGAHKTKIAFVHPKSTGGILVEFVQESL